MATLAVDGIELGYDTRGEGEPLLLLHGFTGTGGDFAHLFDLDALARAHRLIVPDLRGHGRSTNPAGTFTHRRAALDIEALLDELGVARVRAVGLSCGGNVLLHLASRQPARVEAMVLVSATTHYPPEARAIQRQARFEALGADELARLRACHPRGDEQIRALYRQIRAFAEDQDDLRFGAGELGVIAARTLIVQGDRDPLYPVEIGVGLYRGIARSSLWVVPGGGHVPVFGEQREPFVKAAMGVVG
jgi:pimeloyl-ACP methyl ester carboxylesterase